MNPLLTAGIAVAALAVGAGVGWLLGWLRARAEARLAGQVMDSARQEAQSLLREARLQAQDELFRARELLEKESRERRQEAAETEKRLLQREAHLERKQESLDQKSRDLENAEARTGARGRGLDKRQEELEELNRVAVHELERIAGLTTGQARELLLSRNQDEIRQAAAADARRVLEVAQQEAEQEARRILTMAIERCASAQVHAVTTCVLSLPSDDMKGRIIGREGRNIRAFEAVTGVNVLIDDTPQTVVLSGFDPVRREIARTTMERLVADGRINPARIEEEAGRATEEIQASIRQGGEDAVLALGLRSLPPELLELVGRLRFRHSFTQNVLDHSREVASLMGLMAAELGLNVQLAKRVGLLHDIGKAVDHEVEGAHALIGAQFLKRYGEPEEVSQAVACHHHEAEPLTVLGMLCGAADAVSASRPGARSESMDLYVARLEKLESIAREFPGVEKCFALQAGRELRVLVEPDQVTDGDALVLARNVRRRIEEELQYPGQIKVIVVRETRAVEYAR